MTCSSVKGSVLSIFSWEKLLIWALFLLLIYTLRYFFFVIFLTFLISYFMRSLINLLMRTFFGPNPRRFIEPAVSIVCFMMLLVMVYGIGKFIFPQLVFQGQALVKKVTGPEKSASTRINDLLRDSIGDFLFVQKYGERGSAAYEDALKKAGSRYSGKIAAQDFSTKLREIEGGFYEELLVQGVVELPDADRQALLREWVLQHKAREVLGLDRGALERDWEEEYRRMEFQFPGITPLHGLTKTQREDALIRYATSSFLESSATRERLETEWRFQYLREEAAAYRISNPGEYLTKFKEFYASLLKRDPLLFPASEEQLKKIAEGMKVEPDSLKSLALNSPEAVALPMSVDERNASFERAERQTLLDEWKQGELAAKLEGKLEQMVVSLMSWLGSYLKESIPKILYMPFALLLCLLLSFFITFDIPRITRGVQRLKYSRLSHFYDEIAPGLQNFGRLIGRSFLAQTVIAIFNTILTLIVIKMLGIQNEVFLSAIVFICSFIPVVGVVLSGIPIAVMATIQDGGGIMIAIWSIVGILLVHFIETSIFNPKIVGEMLHLHPVLVLTILAVGEHFFGVWGLLLGVPVMVYIIRIVILGEGIPGLIEPPIRNQSEPA